MTGRTVAGRHGDGPVALPCEPSADIRVYIGQRSHNRGMNVDGQPITATYGHMAMHIAGVLQRAASVMQ